MSRLVEKKAIKHAKAQIKRHEGHGCFSTNYYVFLFDKYVEQFMDIVMKQGSVK